MGDYPNRSYSWHLYHDRCKQLPCWHLERGQILYLNYIQSYWREKLFSSCCIPSYIHFRYHHYSSFLETNYLSCQDKANLILQLILLYAVYVYVYSITIYCLHCYCHTIMMNRLKKHSKHHNPHNHVHLYK